MSGLVRAPEGVSVSNVWVGVRYEPTYLLIPEDGQSATYTDKAGAFTIHNVRPGRVTLRASAGHEDYQFDTELILESGKDMKDIRIELTATK